MQCDLRPFPGGRCRHGRVYLGRDRSSRSGGVCPQADDNPRVRRALERLGAAIGRFGGKSAELLTDISTLWDEMKRICYDQKTGRLYDSRQTAGRYICYRISLDE
jgi:hypothetical protein